MGASPAVTFVQVSREATGRCLEGMKSLLRFLKYIVTIPQPIQRGLGANDEPHAGCALYGVLDRSRKALLLRTEMARPARVSLAAPYLSVHHSSTAAELKLGLADSLLRSETLADQFEIAAAAAQVEAEAVRQERQ